MEIQPQSSPKLSTHPLLHHCDQEEDTQGKSLEYILVLISDFSWLQVYFVMWVNRRDNLVKATNTSLCIVKKKGLKILFSSPLCLVIFSFMEDSHD